MFTKRPGIRTSKSNIDGATGWLACRFAGNAVHLPSMPNHTMIPSWLLVQVIEMNFVTLRIGSALSQLFSRWCHEIVVTASLDQFHTLEHPGHL